MRTQLATNLKYRIYQIPYIFKDLCYRGGDGAVIGQSPASEAEAATTLHRQCPRHCHAGQRERPELLHCEAAAAPARQRLATRPGDAHALAQQHTQRQSVRTLYRHHRSAHALHTCPGRIVSSVLMPASAVSVVR